LGHPEASGFCFQGEWLLYGREPDGVCDLNLRTVATSLGLSSSRRLYNDFRDLRLAIVTKNREIRKHRVLEPSFGHFGSIGWPEEILQLVKLEGG
jgi:hypothetical protein